MDEIVAQLAANGVLRAGINLSNPLLVTGRSAAGDPQGISPDMASAIAERLGVAVKYVTYASPGELADAMARGEWDIGLIAVEPARAATIAFSQAYVEIEATYLVPAGSRIQNVEEVDRPGVRIAISERSAYDLYLTRTLKHAELVRTKGLAAAAEMFASGGYDALAGLRPALIDDAARIAGSRVLAGKFTGVHQAIGCKPGNKAGAAFVRAFVEEAIGNGLVAQLIARHGVSGKLAVAEPASA